MNAPGDSPRRTESRPTGRRDLGDAPIAWVRVLVAIGVCGAALAFLVVRADFGWDLTPFVLGMLGVIAIVATGLPSVGRAGFGRALYRLGLACLYAAIAAAVVLVAVTR